jgi:hypothetical protein
MQRQALHYESLNRDTSFKNFSPSSIFNLTAHPRYHFQADLICCYVSYKNCTEKPPKILMILLILFYSESNEGLTTKIYQ